MRIHRAADQVILYIVIGLVLFGLVALSSASSDLGKAKFDDPNYYLLHQLLYGVTLGLGGFLFGLFFPYDKYRKIAPLIFFLGVGMLLLTFTPLGFSAGGATRWVSLGFITVQPAEFLKIAAVIYLSAWLSGGPRGRSDRQKDFKTGFIPFLLICAFIGGLLILQRSTSSFIIIMSACMAIYWASGAKLRYIFTLIGGALLAIALVVTFRPYVLQRFATFLNPGADTTGAGYQINQALTTIGSGGIFGKGYGQSVSKSFLPERIGDSIFAIIAEEFGFFGAIILIMMFLFVVLRSFLIAEKIRDQFGRLMLVGFATVFGIQAFLHIGSISGLIPLTGVPLPFISYGGTALAAFMTAAGIMLNISKRA